mmetsp:Transcript_50243/g.114033  ORF Transcript_50243/g.114033 Transcript_50243/m.114033 type:complete len:207 (+) Transcript_50243:958-1578(+)
MVLRWGAGRRPRQARGTAFGRQGRLCHGGGGGHGGLLVARSTLFARFKRPFQPGPVRSPGLCAWPPPPFPGRCLSRTWESRRAERGRSSKVQGGHVLGNREGLGRRRLRRRDGLVAEVDLRPRLPGRVSGPFPLGGEAQGAGGRAGARAAPPDPGAEARPGGARPDTGGAPRVCPARKPGAEQNFRGETASRVQRRNQHRVQGRRP